MLIISGSLLLYPNKKHKRRREYCNRGKQCFEGLLDVITGYANLENIESLVVEKLKIKQHPLELDTGSNTIIYKKEEWASQICKEIFDKEEKKLLSDEELLQQVRYTQQ